MAVRAPRLKSGVWLNGPEAPLDTFKGSVVLLDFFTYGCINCLNNLYSIRRLRERFGKELVIIGIHSAKFKTEGDIAHLGKAIERLGITYPVIDDASHTLLDQYAIKGWPTVVLIDRNGYIIETSAGEHTIEELERILAQEDIYPSSTPIKERKSLSPSLSFPQKVLRAQAYLFISNTQNDSVWVCDHSGKVLHIYDEIIEPMGMALFDDRLYVAVRGDDTVISIDLLTHRRTVVLSGTRAPYDLEIADGILYVAMAAAHQVLAYSLDDFRELERYGNGYEALRDGTSDTAQLAQPSSLSWLHDQLWFVDAESSSLRLIAGGQVHTAIGEGLFTSGDSDMSPILLQHPQGVVAGQYGDGCGGGRLFIADTFNDKVKVYDPEQGQMMTLIKDLHAPSGISKHGCDLYIADTDAHRIIRFDLSKMHSEVMRFSL